MCGIAGYVTTQPEAVSTAVIERMTSILAHRGPDGFDYYRDPWAKLGHRRLSIIDLAAGTQPMTNESGDDWIVYNGEVFNHADLRPRLEEAGHRYRTHCDTETILHAWEEHGPACVEYFRGMFAFAIWDRRSRKLFCARDRLGIKPFYYFQNERLFAFASEIKALLEHPDISASLAPAVFAEYLAFGYASDEQTLFTGIRKLMPGHRLEFDARTSVLRIERYWEPPAPPQNFEQRSEASWIEECRTRIEETVRMRLMSDVPLGMFLSGGVDSSLIAAIMKRQTGGQVTSFSVGYNEQPYSELSWARRVAGAIGTDHREVIVSRSDFFEALPKLIWQEDEPVAWPSSVPLYFLARRASEEVKVVLTGEGADELFGGYGRYRFLVMNLRWMEAWRWLPRGLRQLVRERIEESPLVPRALRRRLGHTFLARGEDLGSLYLDNFYCAFSGEERADMGAPDDCYAAFRRDWDARPGTSALARALYSDQKTYLVELLKKQDRMSMAASIESRVPFLDHPLVEFAARVPDSLKLRGREGKYLLKRVAEGYLPNAIVYREKMGFPTPLRQWLREPEAGALLERITARDGFLASQLDLRPVETILDRHRRGEIDATDRIWRLLNLELWAGIFLTGRVTPRGAPVAAKC